MGGISSSMKISKKDMEFLMDRTLYDEKEIKKWHKGFHIDCPNGKLTPSNFIKMYEQFFPQGNAQDFCTYVFQTFDTDRNGYIDFREFVMAIDVTSTGSPTDKLKWAFKMCDVDNNGVIDLQEMTKILQAVYDAAKEEHIDTSSNAEQTARDIFQRLDQDSDGTLTETEFVDGCLHDPELRKILAPKTSSGQAY